MGASTRRPTSSAPGSGGSGFYQNALNQQKQAVANLPQTSPNRGVSGAVEGPSVEGKPTFAPAEDMRYLDAYNRYMQERSGGSQYPAAQGSPFGQAQPPAPQQQPPVGPPPDQGRPPMRRRPMGQERPPVSPNGITMGAGYANRPFT